MNRPKVCLKCGKQLFQAEGKSLCPRCGGLLKYKDGNVMG